MNVTNYGQLLQLAWPEIILTITALVAMAADLLFLKRTPLRTRFLVAASRPHLLAVQDRGTLGIDQDVGEVLDVARIAD